MDASAGPDERPWWRERALGVSALLLVLPVVAIAGAYQSAQDDDRPRLDAAPAAVASGSPHDGH